MSSSITQRVRMWLIQLLAGDMRVVLNPSPDDRIDSAMLEDARTKRREAQKEAYETALKYEALQRELAMVRRILAENRRENLSSRPVGVEI